MTQAERAGESPAGYRPISGLAVASSLIGALSGLAVITPAFWMIPIVGIMVATVALADVSREGRPKAGRLAALAGLALSIGFGTQGLTQWLVSDWVAGRRAVSAVELFVEAVRAGRLGEARSMCAPVALPPPLADRRPLASSEPGGGEDGHDGHDHGDDGRRGDDDIADFAAMPAIQRLVESGAGAPPVVKVSEPDPADRLRDGEYRFVVEVPRNGGPPSQVEVSVARDGGGRFDRWVVVRHAVRPG